MPATRATRGHRVSICCHAGMLASCQFLQSTREKCLFNALVNFNFTHTYTHTHARARARVCA